MQAHIHTNTYTIDLIILNDLFKHLLSLILDVLCSCYKNINSLLVEKMSKSLGKEIQ